MEPADFIERFLPADGTEPAAETWCCLPKTRRWKMPRVTLAAHLYHGPLDLNLLQFNFPRFILHFCVCLYSPFSSLGIPSALVPYLLCFRAHLEQMGWIGLTRWRVKESLIIPGIDPPSYLIPRYEAAHRFPTGMLGPWDTASSRGDCWPFGHVRACACVCVGGGQLKHVRRVHACRIVHIMP